MWFCKVNMMLELCSYLCVVLYVGCDVGAHISVWFCMLDVTPELISLCGSVCWM